MIARLQHELRKPGAYALPLRLFIGIGWLRAAAEKLVDPGWRDGTSLQAFLAGQADGGQVFSPLYLDLMQNVFSPTAPVLEWIISVGQLLVGLALVTGTLTNAALLGGVFMNLNFMLAGRPDPSAFYLVIQSALFLIHSGATFGVDGWLSRYLRLDRRHPFLGLAIARHRRCPAHLTLQRRGYLAGVAISLACAGIALANARDFSPGGSVRDSAMVLVVLSLTWTVSALIGYVQLSEPRPAPARRARLALVPAIETERRMDTAA